MVSLTQSDAFVKVRKALEERYPKHDFHWQGRRGLCPEHPDAHPSLYLYPDHAYCFACQHYFPLDPAETGWRAARSKLWSTLAEHLQEGLAANVPEAKAAREWLQELCALDPTWLVEGAPVGEEGRVVHLPLGFIADPRELGEIGRRLARELGIDLEEQKALSSQLTAVADAAFKAWRRKEGRGGTGVVAFFYESTPGRVSTFKFRPVYGTSRESRYPTGKVEGAFGLGLVEPRLLERQSAVVTEGETDLLAIQAAALREGSLFPIIAAGGIARFPTVAQLLEKLEPGAKIYAWPDADVDIEKNKAVREYRALIWPYTDEQAKAKTDPRDLALGQSFEEIRQLVSSSVLTPDELRRRQGLKKAQAKLEKLEIITAPDLLVREFPELRWVIPDLIPEGLTILAGKPKIGKSWLCLELGLAVATGGYALGKIKVDRMEALYLALEDSGRRLQRRLGSLMAEQDERPEEVPPPSGLLLNTAWPRLDQGGLELLEAFLDRQPGVRLVMIDTLAKIKRRGGRKDEGLYDQDYMALEGLHELASREGVGIIIVHHLRKSGAEDPLDLVSGTTGLTGGADTVAILTHSRGEADGELFITGRDVEKQSLALKREATGSWMLLGDAEEYRQSKERREILEVLRDAGEPLAPKEISERLNKNDSTVRGLLLSVLRDGRVRRVRRGLYTLTKTMDNMDNVDNVDNVDEGPNDRSSQQ